MKWDVVIILLLIGIIVWMYFQIPNPHGAGIIERDTVTVRDTLPAPPPIIKYLKGKTTNVQDTVAVDSLKNLVAVLQGDILSLTEVVKSWETKYEDSLCTLQLLSYPITKTNGIDLRLKPRPFDKQLIIETRYVNRPWIEEAGKIAGSIGAGYLLGRLR